MALGHPQNMTCLKIKGYFSIKWLVLLGLLTIAVVLLRQSNIAKDSKPNIILVTFDALRADHLGYAGYPKNTSPFIDSIAEESLVFTNCIAQSGSTDLTISALFTSRFPCLDDALNPKRYMTIAEFLKKEGYTTAAITGIYTVNKKFGFSRGFDYYDEEDPIFRNAHELQKLVKKFFDKKGIIKNNFFLWIHIKEPHSPYDHPTEYTAKFSEPFVGKLKSETYSLYGKQTLLTNKEINELIARYDGSIRYADDNLKEIFRYLDQRKVLENSIIIITADHGESLGEHNIFDHNELYYGIIHVPLIVKIPGYAPAIIDYPVSSIDIFPTILEILGYKQSIPRLNLRGMSLLAKRSYSHVQYSEYGGSAGKYSIIKEGWRLHKYRHDNKDVETLFHVSSDPQETQNLIDIDADRYRDLADELRLILETSEIETGSGIDRRSRFNEEDIEKLRSLGYIN